MLSLKPLQKKKQNKFENFKVLDSYLEGWGEPGDFK